ncbi:MAG: hypothetical protein JRK53_21220 [Deltaproteobacteria bacterium]|nr:hypothetical protein [Deltaproteobacteria bacterium]
MNSNSRYTSNSSFWFVICAITIIAILMSSADAKATRRIITGCDEGVVEKDDQSFPQQALGQPPDRIVNWEVGLNDGIYAIRITSWLDFTPYVYKMSGGKYKWAGLRQATKRLKARNGKYFYAFDFTANHMNSRGVNMWLLQMKPRDQYQQQKMRLIIRHKRCTKSPPPKKPQTLY